MVSNTSSSDLKMVQVQRPPRRLVICCDGSWNRPDTDRPTNVVKVARGVLPVDSNGTSQIVFYDWGVGTAGKLDGITGGAFGDGLSRNVQDAYRFIVANYQPGDQIYLLGFSRGAFTARSVSGLIRQCSIIKKMHADEIPAGYELYRDAERHPDHVDSIAFREKFAHPMPLIEFIGVWDTVGALGIPANKVIEAVKFWVWDRWFGNRNPVASPSRMTAGRSLPRNKHAFHDVALSKIIKNAYHALAIDERRSTFLPTLWWPQDKEYELPDGSQHPQVVRQVWFPGAHSDVGGGNGNVQNSSLALGWMATAANSTGLEFSTDFWDMVKADTASLGPISSSPPGIWRYAGSVMRNMTVNPGGSAGIHPSARKREQDYSPPYSPENLAESTLPEME